MKETNEVKRIETELEVKTYLDRLKYAISKPSSRITFQADRQVDKRRDKKHTNRYTIAYLFPDEDFVDVLKRELNRLTIEEYIETVKDINFPKRSDMRVFGRKYSGEDVYIKIRVELVNIDMDNQVFVMSFHFSDRDFNDRDFPYRKVRGE